MIAIVGIFWRWYYTKAIKDVLIGWRNFILFSLNYFSIPLLLKTLLTPWKRDITRRPRGFDFKEFFEYLTYNTISRGMGFIVRLFTICTGIIFFFAVLILGAVFFVLWLVLPLIMVGLFVLAIILLI